MRKGYNDYPEGWAEFAHALKEAASWHCERCQHPHDPAAGYTLTVHHLLMDKATPFEWEWAFAVLCQRCHLQIQGKVVMEQQWFLPHSPWFRWHAAGWYAWRYLGEELTRPEIETRLDELLALELRAEVAS